MKKGINSLLVIAISLLIVAASITGCSTNTAEKKEPFKVALLVQGIANDHGWNQAALDGVNQLAEKDNGVVTVSEKVAISDIEEIFRGYGEQKYNIIVGHGNEFSDAALRVAPLYPDSIFLVTSTDIFKAPNLGSIDNNNYEQGFLSGAVAGLYTKTGKVGIIGGEDIPSIRSWADGAVAGAKYVNADLEPIVTFTGSFDDTLKAKESAIAMIESKTDVIMQNLDPAGAGVLEACKDSNVAYIGSIVDQYDLAPDIVLTSAVSGLAESIVFVGEKILNGTFEPVALVAGIKEGVVKLAPFRGKFEETGKDMQEKLDQIVKDLSSGKIKNH